MISTAPFTRLLAEKEIDLKQLSQVTHIPIRRMAAIKNGKAPDQEELNVICCILKCQPCDLVEFRKNKAIGHWEWVSD